MTNIEQNLSNQFVFLKDKLKSIPTYDKQRLFALLRNVTILEQKAIDNDLWCGLAYNLQCLRIEIENRILK